MITEEKLALLRAEVELRLSTRRFSHTLGVERAAREIGAHCLPDKIAALSAAALLHDVTKTYDVEKQLKICLKKSCFSFWKCLKTAGLFWTVWR